MKVKVVHGPPLSGKSTYVRENIKDNSMVYDYDRLETALTYKKHHTRAKSNAHRFVILWRMMMLKQLHVEEELDEVWIITSNLNKNLKNDLKGLDTKFIEMEVTKEELLDRLDKDENRPDKKEWKKAIEEYFKEDGKKRKFTNNKQKEKNKMELTLEIKNYDELTDETKELLKDVEFEIIVTEQEDEEEETEEVEIDLTDEERSELETLA